MLPETIWVGPFWIKASIRPGGSGWITALMTPPIFGPSASATLAPQVKTRPSTIFFSMIYLLTARSADAGRQALLKRWNADPGSVEIHIVGRLTWRQSTPQDETVDKRRLKIGQVYARSFALRSAADSISDFGTFEHAISAGYDRF